MTSASWDCDGVCRLRRSRKHQLILGGWNIHNAGYAGLQALSGAAVICCLNSGHSCSSPAPVLHRHKLAFTNAVSSQKVCDSGRVRVTGCIPSAPVNWHDLFAMMLHQAAAGVVESVPARRRAGAVPHGRRALPARQLDQPSRVSHSRSAVRTQQQLRAHGGLQFSGNREFAASGAARAAHWRLSTHSCSAYHQCFARWQKDVIDILFLPESVLANNSVTARRETIRTMAVIHNGHVMRTLGHADIGSA